MEGIVNLVRQAGLPWQATDCDLMGLRRPTNDLRELAPPHAFEQVLRCSLEPLRPPLIKSMEAVVSRFRAPAVAGLCLVSLVAFTAAICGEEPPTNVDGQPADQLPRPQPAPGPGADVAQCPCGGPLPACADERPRLNAFWDHGVVLESSDAAYRLHIGGRFDFDNTWYNDTQSLPFTLQDGSDMRRARLRADGTIGETIDFVTEVNFANIQDVTNEDTTAQIGSVGLTDFYADFKQVPIVQNLRLGHVQPPLGLENLSSSNNWYYMECSPGHDAFLQPFIYVTGIETFNTWCDDRITGAVAFERVGKNDISPFAFGSGPGKYAVTGRVTSLPFYEDEGRRLLHLGIGYDYSGTDNNFYAANRPLVRAGAGPQDVPNIIFSGTYFTPNPVQIVDVELAAVVGRFALSAEYQVAIGKRSLFTIQQRRLFGPHGNVTYQGMYVEMGCFLNPDDYRRYDKKKACGAANSRRRHLPRQPRPRCFFSSTCPCNSSVATVTLTWHRASPCSRPLPALLPAGRRHYDRLRLAHQFDKCILSSTTFTPA